MSSSEGGSGSCTSERRILVVDDNPAVLKLIGSLFVEEGMTVRLATSVQQAREFLGSGEAFDLVLSDISMPVETGFDLLEWIKNPGSPYAELPVLLTTAQLPEAENRVKGLAMGAVDYVVRPIELRELVLRSIHAMEHFIRVRTLETSLQNSENLAMVGRLLAASNHEIKNMAALVRMCSEQVIKMFSGRAEAGSSEAAMLTALGESSSLLADVARSVNTLFEPQAAASSTVNLMELVKGVVAMMAPRVRPCRLQVRGPAAGATSDAWAMGQPVRIKQVLINLILNAAEAIEELGPEAGGQINVRIVKDQLNWRLEVQDNGIGFNHAGERSEFPAFATTKKLRGGQGLGLWLCARLLQNMSGRLTLKSEGPGLGATAVMQLKSVSAPEAGLDFDITPYLVDD